jgi:VIT1/CCC1 family predicted Fe2+/Mn2+ transporter/demethoxyubiquinone hydroxylase (CLK1/Coq7/Cat5 family)
MGQRDRHRIAIEFEGATSVTCGVHACNGRRHFTGENRETIGALGGLAFLGERSAVGLHTRAVSRKEQWMNTRELIVRYQRNLQGEIDSAALYRAMSSAERNPQLAELYARLAAVEEKHLAFWRRKLEEVGATPGRSRPGWRTPFLIGLARRFGPDSVVGTAATLEHIDRDQYDEQAETRDTVMPRQERSHARILSQLARERPSGWSGEVFSRLEGRHGAGGGNALRAAVLGANDGLVSNLSLVMGVAGASFSQQALLLTGLAGLAAGACSMAMGEWLSVQNAREMYRNEIASEKDELEHVPDEEQEELTLVYRAKGVPEDQAQALAEGIMKNKDTALDTLSREELGINPDDLGGSAWAAAASSFVVFAVGAIFPVAPFFFVSGTLGVITSVALSAAALFAIGAIVTVFTGRSAVISGARQVAIGLIAAAVTYGFGHMLGVAVRG